MATRTYRPLQMHRIPYTELTESQVAQALRPTASGPASKSTLSNVLAGKPLQGDSTIARMARLQGQAATRRWESGRIEARYVKAQDKWKIMSLYYVAA